MEERDMHERATQELDRQDETQEAEAQMPPEAQGEVGVAVMEEPRPEAQGEAQPEAQETRPEAQAGAQPPVEEAAQSQAQPEAPPEAPQREDEPRPAETQGFAEILAEFEQGGHGGRREDPGIGDKVSGRILSIGDETTFVDLGTKSEAAIATAELRNKEGALTVAVGDAIDAQVSGRDPESNCLVLRKKPARGPDVGAEIRQAFEHGLPVEGLVTAVNKGGVEVQVGGLRAFCPISQLEPRFVEDAAPYVGQRYSFRVTRFEEASAGRRPNIVLSRRALLEEEAQAQAAETRAKLAPGAVVRGKVTSLTTYGAFVDLGGLEGMLHVSEIGHSRVSLPKDVLSVGQEIEVQILKIEKGKDEKRPERISLSRKALERDPWRDAATRFTEGSEVDGRVVRLETFGAFVELAPGLDGLIHVSELGAGRRIQHPREAVQLGQDLRVRVLGVDTGRRRISLGLPGGGRESGRQESGRQEGGRPEGGRHEGGRPEGGRGDGGRREGSRQESRQEGGRREGPRREEADQDYAGKSSGASGFGSLGDFFKNDRKRR